MNTTRLGNTGLEVSRICLGTMQFGWTADRDASFAVLDAYVEAGGNFIDTADIYSRWAEGNPGGVAETIIGEWLADRGNRLELVVATKVRGRMWDGPNGEGLSRAHIMRAVDDSLRRLGTDYIDLYQTHWRDLDTPIEETLRSLDDLVSAGKVRYLGCSNLPAWQLVEAEWTARAHELSRYVSLQPHYNLAHREEFEEGLEPVCERYGIGVIPYSPLAAGFLTGKYRPAEPLPDSRRAEGVQRRYLNERGFAVLAACDEVAQAHSALVAQVALAWLLARPSVTAPIVGANSVAQLQELLPADGLELTTEEVAALSEASAWEAAR
ncbi:MAG: aldo/keto reductase [Anaerolineae bacterium]